MSPFHLQEILTLAPLVGSVEPRRDWVSACSALCCVQALRARAINRKAQRATFLQAASDLPRDSVEHVLYGEPRMVLRIGLSRE